MEMLQTILYSKHLDFATAGIAPSALATYLQVSWQKSVPTAQAQCIYALYPVFAVLIGVNFGGEELDASTVFGGSLVLLAALIANTWCSSN